MRGLGSDLQRLADKQLAIAGAEYRNEPRERRPRLVPTHAAIVRPPNDRPGCERHDWALRPALAIDAHRDGDVRGVTFGPYRKDAREWVSGIVIGAE